jgi:hypothetical protein
MYYDVAKLRAKAANSAIKVNGFTLTNKGTLDITKYVDDVKVFADDAEIKDAKWTINKDDELKVTLDGINVEAKTNITFTVSVKLSSDFDDFQKTINFKLANDSDFNAIESKTEARVKITANATDKDYKVYTFV